MATPTINISSLELPTLRNDNPYSTGSVFIFPDNSLSLDRELLVYVKSQNDRYYTIGDGDTLWNISYQAYGSSKYWWVIADVNNLFGAFDLNTGDTLLIPDLNTIQANN